MEKEFYERMDKKAALILSAVDPYVSGKLSFEKDKYYGELGENFVKNFLIYTKNMTYIMSNKTNSYDIQMSNRGKSLTFEVKTDLKVHSDPEIDTGNLFVEFESRGKPSGISVVNSNYYIFYFPKIEQVWIIVTEDLKKLIETNNFKIGIGGDNGSKTKGYLVNRKKFKHNFKTYDVSILPPKKF